MIKELRAAGLTAEAIVRELSLPYDIEHTISPTNQQLMEKMRKKEAECVAREIAELRQYKMEDEIPEDKKEKYRELKRAFEEEAALPCPNHEKIASLMKAANDLLK